MKKTIGILSMLLLIGSAQASMHEHAKEEKPNIIFILVDDLGFQQLGVYGDSKIKTPNLDELANNGIKFTQAYASNTVCSPSRVGLFTGRDGRIMVDNSNGVQLREIDVTMTQVLKHANYDTALFGKWSIGGKMGLTDPLAKGFDTWYGMFGILEGHRQYPKLLWRDNQKIRIAENEGGKKGAYAQALFTHEAIKYIEQDRDNPFFMVMSYSSPHAELAAPQKYVDMYDGVFDETPYTGMSSGEPSDFTAWYYPEPVENPNAVLAAMITALDDYVGQLVKALEEKGVADNTLIFFTSDNGPHREGGADPIYMNASGPYKGMKRDLYDGGIHVPMIVHWPEKIKTGREDHTPWTFADVLPTLADIADVDLLSVPRLKTNGESVKSLLSDNPTELDERILYWEFAKQLGDPNSGTIGSVFQAARKGDFKAVKYGNDRPVELYNIVVDPSESNELSAKYPQLYKEFVTLFDEHR